MARSYAAVHHRIWADPAWRSLDVHAQHLYLLLISQPQMNLAGVLPLQLRKWASCVDGWDIADVAAALDKLRDARFVLVDEDTEEVLIRTMIRNDGSYKIPNVLKSLLQAAEGTQAPELRAAIGVELGRLEPLDGKKAEECAAWIVATRRVLGASEGPSGPGGEPFPEPLAEPFPEGLQGTLNGTVNQPFPEPLPEGSGSGSGSVSRSSYVDLLGGKGAPHPEDEPPPCPKHAHLPSHEIPGCWACARNRERWEKAREEAAKPAPWPAWCGVCNEQTRQVEVAGRDAVARCPECHPSSRKAAS